MSMEASCGRRMPSDGLSLQITGWFVCCMFTGYLVSVCVSIQALPKLSSQAFHSWSLRFTLCVCILSIENWMLSHSLGPDLHGCSNELWRGDWMGRSLGRITQRPHIFYGQKLTQELPTVRGRTKASSLGQWVTQRLAAAGCRLEGKRWRLFLYRPGIRDSQWNLWPDKESERCWVPEKDGFLLGTIWEEWEKKSWLCFQVPNKGPY